MTVAIVFFMQSWMARENMMRDTEKLITQIESKLAQNQKDIQEITQALDKESIVKAKSLAYIIAEEPSVLNQTERLNQIKEMLNIDGLCVSDEQGVLRWGTDYIGFDMNSSEQSRIFMKALADKSFVLAQEPKVNGAKQQMSQFCGVARQDRPGIIQVEFRPERLEKALEQNKIQNVLSGYVVGNSGYLIAVNNADGLIAAHRNDAWIGKTAKEANLPEEKEGNGFISIDGQDVFYKAEVCGAWTIYSVLPQSELYRDRNAQVLVFFIAVVFIFSLLVYMIDRMLQKLIVSGIDSLDAALRKITSGDLNYTVNVNNTEEFERLSIGLNKMVQSIKDEMIKTEKRGQETFELLEAQKGLLLEVRASFEHVTQSSEKMNEVSRQIKVGAGSQNMSMKSLMASIDEVSAVVEESAATAADASEIAANASVCIKKNDEEMARMLEAMKEINETSAKIGNVIKTVNSIAEQTNILAINASIEAARAGEIGRGFAVVAKEVGDLAAQSADAVKETETLVQEALRKNALGTKLLSELAENFSALIEEAKRSNVLTNSIGEATGSAAVKFGQILESVQAVNEIAHHNQSIALESAGISAKLHEQARKIEEKITNYKG